MSSQTLSEPHWATPPNILPRQDVHKCRQKVVRGKDETYKTPEMNIIQHCLAARTIPCSTPAAVHGKVVHDENQLFITAFNILVNIQLTQGLLGLGTAVQPLGNPDFGDCATGSVGAGATATNGDPPGVVIYM
ncbi:hypothetical protein Bbelb_317880 [Branchiostoma belcheri]|nr:hypothetical protein Bbelb_317880 [Branchiostoma belcheri]